MLPTWCCTIQPHGTCPPPAPLTPLLCCSCSQTMRLVTLASRHWGLQWQCAPCYNALTCVVQHPPPTVDLPPLTLTPTLCTRLCNTLDTCRVAATGLSAILSTPHQAWAGQGCVWAGTHPATHPHSHHHCRPLTRPSDAAHSHQRGPSSYCNRRTRTPQACSTMAVCRWWVAPTPPSISTANH